MGARETLKVGLRGDIIQRDCNCKNTEEVTFKAKDLFWFTVLEAPVRDQSTLCSSVMVENHGKSL